MVLVEENGPIHTSKPSLTPLANRADWLTVKWLLPKAAPELNDIEGVWPDLKAHYLACHTFTDAKELNQANKALKHELITYALAAQRISA